jgi:VanZ family protein
MEQVEHPNQAPVEAIRPLATPPRRLPFGDWAPAIIWMAGLFLLSTSFFSASNTSKVIEPLLQWFFPTASIATITLLHALIRKAAHFTNYAILFWLLIRGPLRGRPYVALGCCVLYAMLDEGHQIFVPGRGASLYDVALDSSGALFSRFLNLAVEDVA